MGEFSRRMNPRMPLSLRTLRAAWAALALAAMAAPTAGRAAEPNEGLARAAETDPSALCVAAVHKAEQRHGTPPGLLRTMATVESGRPVDGKLRPWPWTVDADGRGYFFASKDAAVTWARDALANGTVQLMDVGCMQVNLQMHPHAFGSLDEAFDPGANADYAARFLAQLRAGADGNWYTAIGFYHSQTPVLATWYREAVAAVAAGRPIPGGGGAPLYMRSLRRGAVLLTLSGGGATLIPVNRQPSRRGPRHYTACQIAAVLGSYLRSPPKGCHGAKS